MCTGSIGGTLAQEYGESRIIYGSNPKVETKELKSRAINFVDLSQRSCEPRIGVTPNLKEQHVFTYEKAGKEDAEAIDSLMSTEGIFDSEKIVILPHKFRKGKIEEAIQAGRFFVARDNEAVVGYKKLFVMKNEKERKETLEDEIRCVNGTLIDAHTITFKKGEEVCKIKMEDPVQEFGLDSDLYIYNGGDFTKNLFRGKGINPELTKKAFEMISEDAKNVMQEQQAKRLVLLYGLTHHNDYDDLGKGISRSPSILQSFTAFAKDLTGSYPKEVRHYRYRAFMPTFDLDNPVCRPKQDSEAIPGYGNVLVVDLPV